MYRRDSVELRRGVGWCWRCCGCWHSAASWSITWTCKSGTERLVVQNSQVAVLIDTSVIMSRADSDGASSIPQSPVRIDQVADALSQSDFLAELRKTHDVLFYRFDQELVRLATLPKVCGRNWRGFVE